MLLERRDPAGHRALHLPGGDLRLVERGGLDQVAHGLGPRQIDAPVEKGAQRELAGLGEPRARLAGALQGEAQHDRRAVAGDLHHVLGGIGAGPCEEGDHHLVDRVALGVHQARRAGRSRDANPPPPGNAGCAPPIARACGPERRTTPNPPRPGGVEMATMVSWRFKLSGGGARLEYCGPGGPSGRRAGDAEGASRRIDDHLAVTADAGALAAHAGLVAQGQVHDPALPAGHRIEAEGHAGAPDLFGRRGGAQAQLFDAQHAIVVGVEAQPRMVLRGHAQHLHGEVLERQQQLGAVGQQQIHVRAGELDHDFGVLELGVGVLRVDDLELHTEAGTLEKRPEKRIDFRPRRFGRVLPIAHWLFPAAFLCSGLRRRGHGQRRRGKPVEQPLLRDPHQVAGQPV